MRALKWVLGSLAGVVALLLVLGAVAWMRLHPEPPDIQVWHSGNVLTMDADGSVATAIAIEGERLSLIHISEPTRPSP